MTIDRKLLGPIYREGPLTLEDYDEAIEDLRTARNNLEEIGIACACGDCFHGDCLHNPLAMARLIKLRPIKYRCFHCGAVFSDKEENEAREHFGISRSELPACLRDPRSPAGK